MVIFAPLISKISCIHNLTNLVTGDHSSHIPFQNKIKVLNIQIRNKKMFDYINIFNNQQIMQDT